MRIISGTARGTKLYTLEGIDTRPTLDRIKEALFSIIQSKITDSVVLDLFAGSGALGIESLSRGASFSYFCDNSAKACNIINQNIEKTHLKDKSLLYNTTYKNCLKKLKENNINFDIIFLDPPYESDLIYLSIKEIIDLKILKEDGIIIAETDNEQEIINELKKLQISIYNIKRYGRVKLLFLKQFKSSEGMV